MFSVGQQTLAAMEGQTMGIGTATHQKATSAQIRRNGFAYQRGGLPGGTHGVVILGFGPVKAQIRRRRQQAVVGQSIAGGVGQ